VRALTEKYYDRVADTFVFPDMGEGEPSPLLVEALAELRTSMSGAPGFLTLRHARLSEADAVAQAGHLSEWAESFAAQEATGDTVFGLVMGLYPTSRPSLPPDDPS
jgi:hypothetical protein